MKPVSPVVPGFAEITYAKDQPRFLPLPAIKCIDGMVISRWKLSWKERLRIFLTGDLWLQQLAYNDPLQAQLPGVTMPRLRHLYKSVGIVKTEAFTKREEPIKHADG